MYIDTPGVVFTEEQPYITWINIRITKLRYISAPRMLLEAGHIKNTVVLIFRHIQYLHVMYSEVAWVLVSSGTQVQSQIIFDSD